MSWIIEQSDDASSAITTQGNTVTCQKEDFYGSPINVLWKDPAEKSGLYYWQIDFLQLDTQGSVGVGLTTQDHFKVGYAIKFMEYNGNLADGSAGLICSFGDCIKQGDNIGILLNLTDSEMKESMRKEDVISKLIDGIADFKLQGQQLIITSNGNQVKFERYTPEAPQAYTKNIFAAEY
ncbi:unnamed protein product [Rotaria sp. Silwood1]|nr:unnamed protein product [Rotaria sp. Silwood1]CAF4972194.1 unnamed protein product [Rotaria sp. Silwood1]